MAIGTIIMIVCLVMLVIVEFLFKKDSDDEQQEYSVYGDPDFNGLDGCGVLGQSIDDLNKNRGSWK